jgi:2-oxoglutarate dehydrogenase E2 component (dihydrolipoamide succinyltransferase)
MSLVDLVMPKLGESIMEATILKWYKQVGDTINLDETLLDIATDKVDSEVPSTVGGVIKEILFGVNDVVPIGAVIARIETSDVNVATAPTLIIEAENTTDQVTPTPVVAELNSTSTAIIPDEVPFVPTANTATIISSPVAPQNAYTELEEDFQAEPGEIKFYSPLVLNIAQSEGVSFQELQKIKGTGSLGRVSKRDILNYIAIKKGVILPNMANPINASPTAQVTTQTNTSVSTNEVVQNTVPLAQQETIAISKPTAPISTNPTLPTNQNNTNKFSDPTQVILTGNTALVEMDRMRKLIAKHMVDSVQTSPHVTSFVEADVTNLVLWREKVKQQFETKEGTKLTFTPIFIEGIAAALEQFPLVNSSLQNDQIVYKKDINIGMATALPSGNLIVPVIKGANQMNIVGLSKAVNGLANAARNNQLKPADTQGGTFTVTNVGTFGSIMGTPIINQPQVAILALGAIKKRAVVMETPQGDAIAIRHMMYLSMSYDHRIVDGAIGTQFLAAVVKAFESWDLNKQW